MCQDKTIRNRKTGLVLTAKRGSKDVGLEAPMDANQDLTVHLAQQWNRIPVFDVTTSADMFGRLYNIYTKKVDSGIPQDVFYFENEYNSRVLEVSGYDGNGDIQSWSNQHLSDQQFYFRDRGSRKFCGQLMNEKSGECMDVKGYNGDGTVQTYACEKKPDQEFCLYENGELVNQQSGYCVDIRGYNAEQGSDIITWPCESLRDQRWEMIETGGYFALKSLHQGNVGTRGICLDVSGYNGSGNVKAWQCENLPDQRWKIRKYEDVYERPEGKWKLVADNQSGSISQTVEVGIETQNTQWSEDQLTIGVAIEADTAFGGVSVNTEYSRAWGREFSEASSTTTSFTVVCEFNKDGSIFTGGEMWQWVIDVEPKNAALSTIHWQPLTVRCTEGYTGPPSCPPGVPEDECVDNALKATRPSS